MSRVYDYHYFAVLIYIYVGSVYNYPCICTHVPCVANRLFCRIRLPYRKNMYLHQEVLVSLSLPIYRQGVAAHGNGDMASVRNPRSDVAQW